MKRGPACKICEHSQRAEIELALANEVPARIIARRFECHHQAAWRHKKNHMSADLVKRLKISGHDQPVDLERLRITESEGLLQHLVALRGREYAMLDKVERLCDPGDFAKIDARLHANLTLTAKLLGELKTGATNNYNLLIMDPQFHRLQVGLRQALRPFPEALKAVDELLQAIDREEAQSVERPALEHEP